MGCVRQRTPGSWQLLYYYQGKQVSKTIRATKKDAERMLREIERSIDLGTYEDSSKQVVTVGQVLRGWLESLQGHRKESTIHRYRRCLDAELLKEFGGVDVKALTPQHLETYYRRRVESGLSPATVQLYHAVMGGALKRAVRFGLVDRNVASIAAPPAIGDKKKPNVLTDEQIARFMHCSAGMTYGPQAMIALATGMRAGEIASLRWSDIDLGRGEIVVENTAARLGRGEVIVQKAKTASSRRRISLDRETIEMFSTLPVKGEYIFGGDKPVSPNTMSIGISRHCRALGYDIAAHGLRHSHASLLNRREVNPKVVQERLGHSCIVETMNTYTHLLPSQQQTAVAAVSDVRSLER